MNESGKLKPEPSGEELAVDLQVAAKKLGLSRSYIYKLPNDTPGIYRFGRKKKINMAELMAWARKCSVELSKTAGAA